MPTRPLTPTALEIDSYRIKLSDGDNIVGRACNGGEAPHIILDPFDAQKKGVSRRHILIKRVNDVVIVKDLSSANGTWLNGQRLTPDTEYPLRGGDKLRLGSLELAVAFDNPSPWDLLEQGSEQIRSASQLPFRYSNNALASRLRFLDEYDSARSG